MLNWRLEMKDEFFAGLLEGANAMVRIVRVTLAPQKQNRAPVATSKSVGILSSLVSNRFRPKSDISLF